jgi:hypothetical protein
MHPFLASKPFRLKLQQPHFICRAWLWNWDFMTGFRIKLGKLAIWHCIDKECDLGEKKRKKRKKKLA